MQVINVHKCYRADDEIPIPRFAIFRLRPVYRRRRGALKRPPARAILERWSASFAHLQVARAYGHVEDVNERRRTRGRTPRTRAENIIIRARTGVMMITGHTLAGFARINSARSRRASSCETFARARKPPFADYLCDSSREKTRSALTIFSAPARSRLGGAG